MKKRVLSVFLAILVVVSIIPIAKIESSAASTVNDATFLTRLADAKSRFRQGEYFSGNYGLGYNLTQTSSTLKCTGTNANGSTCVSLGYCAGGGWCTCNCGTYYYGGVERCWQCWAFACQVGYDIFGVDSYAGWSKHKNASNIKAGDIVRFSWSTSYAPHSVFVLKIENGTVYYADCNASGPCKVNWNNSMSVSRIQTLMNNRTESEFAVYHAPNSAVSANPSASSTPTPSINYVTGLAGDYYLQNKSTGYWLAVSEGKDASTQPINTWGNWGTDFRVKLTASGNGYKIKFPNISSLLVNPYGDIPASGTKINLYQDVNDSTQCWGFEKVGDAYAIRCLYNPSLVLTSNGTNQATLTTYTGATNQLWYLHPYTRIVSYNANGGSGAPSSQTKYFNETLTLSSTRPTRSGYTFLGWSTSSTATSATYSAGGSFTTNANTTLYAVWMPQNIEICVDGNPNNQYWTLILEDYENVNCYLTLNEYYGNPITYSYSVNNSNVSCSIGNANSSNQTPFSVSANSIGETIITLSVKDTATNVVLDNINIYVTVKSKEYTISYDANGGTGAPETSTHQSGTTHTVSSTIPERFGCTFLGWGKTPDATQYYWPGESFSVTSNITLYAKWSGAEWLSDWQPNEEMAVIFAPDCCTYYYMEPSATRTYHFESIGSVDSRITIYDKNGTELITDDDSGEELNFSLDYTFNAGQKYFIKIHAYNNATGDILFTAKPYWNLTYDANGGSGAPPSLNTTHGTTLYLSSTIPTRSGYTFLGWSTSSTATNATYSAGSSYTINSNITLYAVWQKNEVTNANKWVKDSKGWRYYDANGSIVKNQWKADSVGWCYLGADGYCVTNCWKADSHGWCYLDANGRMVCNNWVYDGGKWYFMDANGYMVSNQWRKDSKGWCYLGSSGAMLTNAWVKDSVGWCYVGADGYCVTNKWVKDSKGWCYLDSQGRMVYNKWVKDSVGWCYVGSSGYMVTNQWVQDGGKWYYLDANGYMVTGTKVINGKTYKFNSSGVWIG